MRIYWLNTKIWLTHEIGIRYLQGIGLEIMLWWGHIQILYQDNYYIDLEDK